MDQHRELADTDYPHGRGYGHDYMRGGEVFGGYGYSEREEYDRPRGELQSPPEPRTAAADEDDGPPVS